MPIARFFARAAVLLIIVCTLVTGAAYGLGKVAPSNAGLIYFSTHNRSQTRTHQYVFDPTHRARFDLTLQHGMNATPLPSPDGRRFAFKSHVDGIPEFRIFDWVTMEITPLYRQPAADLVNGEMRLYSWSPSGRYLSFATSQLYKIDYSSGEVSPIIVGERDRIVNDASPTWSPDETRIAFVSASRQTDYWQAYLVNDDGSDLRRVTRADVCAFFRPHWSPISENLIVFDAACDNIPTIFLLDTATQRFAPLSDFTTPTSSPLWSPDGSKILFVVGAAPQTRSVYVYDVARSQTTYLTDGSVALWSPDGSKILFSGTEGDLYTIRFDGRELERLTFYDGEQFVYPLAWSR